MTKDMPEVIYLKGGGWKGKEYLSIQHKDQPDVVKYIRADKVLMNGDRPLTREDLLAMLINPPYDSVGDNSGYNQAIGYNAAIDEILKLGEK